MEPEATNLPLQSFEGQYLDTAVNYSRHPGLGSSDRGSVSQPFFHYDPLREPFKTFFPLNVPTHEILISQISNLSISILYVCPCFIHKMSENFFSPPKNKFLSPLRMHDLG